MPDLNGRNQEAKTMDIERNIDKAVEAHTAWMLDKEQGDLEELEEVTDEDYYGPISMEDFRRDSGDLLLNLNNDEFEALRKNLRDLLFWHKYMINADDAARHYSMTSSTAFKGLDIAALLLRSLDRSNITLERLDK